MSGPLTGIRVVDFSRVLAGPLCARTLQDLGAEVIKIEPPSPDVSRFAFPSTDGMSGYYAQQNAGKRNVSINLNLPGALELILKLCDTAACSRRCGALIRMTSPHPMLRKSTPPPQGEVKRSRSRVA
jgi:crotonobetainyl-CoA:carnitine CoA-transferase CaiB-like acyl-CoA transferase